ncbi:3-keto-disaccharide hydrolase [Sediminibacterium soli]|uniref:3-keto-disaccharide hydrolase n=1 Tax=Sediminibacterium soli TaxID=2698829 RepID=UPI00137A6B05|nr:DUF1080 domain-containing protein [Sediminibacterium soli]NCI46432.1 DUF1080 domain-containing protein [Sediminibacterium soli]
MQKRIHVYFLALACCFFAQDIAAQTQQLTDREQQEGWKLLFDGVTTKGWKKANGQPFPEKGWTVENGVLRLDTAAGRGGDIITDEQFTDFELVLDFKTVPGANSGIKYFLLPNTSLGCEFQVLDDERHPDAKLGVNGNRKLGGLYDLIAPDAGKKENPPGEWNQARILAKGNHVEHWLNGKKTVEYDRDTPAFKALVAASKYKNNKGFGETVQSPILLQDHGNTVSFRNIRIRKI